MSDAFTLPRRRGRTPHRLQQLYDLLVGKGDVAIDELYHRMAGPPTNDPQFPQRWLSPYISRLNRRLRTVHREVIPGDLKQTYRLVVTK